MVKGWTGVVGLAVLLGATPALADGVSASSVRVSAEGNGAAAQAFDGDLATSWVEGAPGLGRGEWVEARFDKPQRIHQVTVFGGRFSSSQEFKDFGHIEKAIVSWTLVDGTAGEAPIWLGDTYEPATVPLGAEVKAVRLTLDALYDGARYSETHVAEIAFNWGQPLSEVPERLATYKASRQGKPAADASAAALTAALEAVKTPEGLSAGLPLLLSTASRGADIDRAWLARELPPGFQLNYLRADPALIQVLADLKEVSALPVVERAAAREWEAWQRSRFTRLASWFRAYEEFTRTAPEAVPFWGARGTVPGTFQSQGEPLSIATASGGWVFVADLGNNRVQRFESSGRVTAVSAGERTIDETFMGKASEAHVVGAAAAQTPGRFVAPLYLAVVLDGKEERVAVIDAGLRVQILDLDLKPVTGWKVEAEVEILSGIGLRGPLLAQGKPGELTVFVGDEAIVYTLTGEEKYRFHVGGEPRAVAVVKKRYLLAFGGDEVVAYTLPGFKDGTFFTLPKEDRSEDLDLTADERGGLLIHTDSAFVYQVDKKGRLLAAQRTFKEPVWPYRIAARGGILYVAAGDTLHRFELVAPE